jgi:hypothetical protein
MGRVVRHLCECGAALTHPSTFDAAHVVLAQLTAAQTLCTAASIALAQSQNTDFNALRKELRRWAGRARAVTFLAKAGAEKPAAAFVRLLFGPDGPDDGDCLVVRVLELKNKFARLDPTHFRFAHFVLLLCKGTTVMPAELQIHHADIKQLNDERGGHGHYETLRVRVPVDVFDCGGRCVRCTFSLALHVACVWRGFGGNAMGWSWWFSCYVLRLLAMMVFCLPVSLTPPCAWR